MEFVLMAYPGKLPAGTFMTNDGTRYVYKRNLYAWKEHESELKEHGYERSP
jgi:hypothetical protein